jgi:hypothetical protein
MKPPMGGMGSGPGGMSGSGIGKSSSPDLGS